MHRKSKVAAFTFLGLATALAVPPASAQEQQRQPAQQQGVVQGPAILVVQPVALAVPLAGPVEDYLGWAALFDPEQMSLSHTYTAEGLRRLQAMLESIAEPGVSKETQQRLERLGDLTQQLVQSPDESLRHANMIRAASLAAVEVMERVANERRPQDTALQEAIAAARREASQIDPDQPTLEQRGAVGSFFRETVLPVLVLATPPHPSAG